MSTSRTWCIRLLILVLLAALPSRAQDLQVITLEAFGKTFPGPSQTIAGLTYVQADSWRMQEILKPYSTSATWDGSSLTIGQSTWKASDPRAVSKDAAGNDVTATLLVQDGHPWMPVLGLPTMISCRVGPGQEEGTLVVDPLITDISLVPDRSDFALHVKSSAPVTSQTLVLKCPDRFVVDISGAALDLDHFGSTRAIDHPDLGQVRFGQFSYKPDVVRIVIPLQNDLEVEPLPVSTPQHLVMALRRGDVRVMGQNFNNQKITSVKLQKTAAGVQLLMQVTGPVQCEWHRLRPPDNRIFVDIPQAVLVGPRQSIDTGDTFATGATVSQFQVTPTPVVRIVFALSRPGGFDIKARGPNHDQLVMTVQNKALALTADDTMRQIFINTHPAQGATICIDPGHGGSDSGAVNRWTGLEEKTVTLDISLRLAALLKKAGWNVFLTRDRDKDVTYAGSSNTEELYARCRVAEQVHADLFVSIHCNANNNPASYGTSTHWYKSMDWPLAKDVLNRVVAWTKGTNRGAQQNRFYVLKHTTMPSVLVETAYITNRREGALLGSPAYRQKKAEAIFAGLQMYVASHPRKVAGNRGLSHSGTW
ncbi:MAG: N-acetylmuramoyl-L-alanine amidase [Candidatus Xenobia bacterium]